jgi:hypothetical protein
MIPQILYKDLASGKVSAESIADIRSVGTVIVKGAIPLEVDILLGWSGLAVELPSGSPI